MIPRKPHLFSLLLDFVLPVLVTPVLVAQSLLVPDDSQAAVRLEIQNHPNGTHVSLNPSSPANATHVVFGVTSLDGSMFLQLSEALGIVLARGPKIPLVLHRLRCL